MAMVAEDSGGEGPDHREPVGGGIHERKLADVQAGSA
jgi:hypothetical protein